MDAMLAHKPERVPVAANLKYTEDCKQIKPGEGEWTKISGLTAYRRDILDVREGVAVSFLVIEEDKSPVLYALRLKIADKKITEIESMAVHGHKEGMILDTSNLQTASKMMVSFPDKTQLGTQEMIGGIDLPGRPENRQLCQSRPRWRPMPTASRTGS
jgi:hypothetical protein